MSIGMHTLKSDYFLTASRNAASGINFMNQVSRRMAHAILICQSAANQHSELIPGHKHCDVSQGHLFQNYTISTYKTMVEDGDTHQIWQKHLVEWGLQFPSLLHLILSLSALHLASENPESREQYLKQADDHFTFGMRSVTGVLSQLDEDNCQKIYMAAVIICFVYFGRGPRPGEYLVFSQDGPAEWLVLMRGVRLILQTYHAQVFSGILEPNSGGREYILSPEMRSELHEIMREVYSRRSAGSSGVSLMDVLIGWLYRLPEGMVALLEEKEPHALVVLAYWAVMLLYMESAWFMRGWAEHVLLGISSSLHLDFRPWIEWPLRRMRSAGVDNSFGRLIS